ncbi:uncharacterized protein [Oryza sativa Japonica Group]|uniref:Uncharacterized protein n=1 Tax=Oryza sativa subsp. japonica TaxID=39947 RepID=Q851F8_ORYSJ|nr:uncharacterized protein LOC4333986 [Oryza sativa Japonica Group]AAO38479.1 unknown protein [Oryza sativa Japonica Group]KAF2941113.1 hypothetical protein DAI22_03g324400 [Oryza sativa Japonica Group]
MLLVSQAANGSVSARRLPSKQPGRHGGSGSSSVPNPYPLFATTRLLPHRRRRRLALSGADARRGALAAAGEGPSGSPATTTATEDPVLVGVTDEGVPLEGVIQFDKPGDAAAESKLVSYAKLGLLASGDVLCLLVFSAIGRFSHGLPVLDAETFKTADPFIAGWLLSAYLLGGFGDDAKGRNGVGNAVVVAAKSWAVGIPLGLAIRALSSGHIPPTPFILVAMGSTWVLLTGWRALVSLLFSTGQSQQDDVYRRGSPFELFELLTSLVRRW